jgi:hypothetical protein
VKGLAGGWWACFRELGWVHRSGTVRRVARWHRACRVMAVEHAFSTTATPPGQATLRFSYETGGTKGARVKPARRRIALLRYYAQN